MGSLFMKNFKRKEIDSEKYLFQLVHYIHHNPTKANLVEHPENWHFSSYRILLSKAETFVKRDQVFDWYDGRENFEKVHFRRSSYDLLE